MRFWLLGVLRLVKEVQLVRFPTFSALGRVFATCVFFGDVKRTRAFTAVFAAEDQWFASFTNRLKSSATSSFLRHDAVLAAVLSTVVPL